MTREAQKTTKQDEPQSVTQKRYAEDQKRYEDSLKEAEERRAEEAKATEEAEDDQSKPVSTEDIVHPGAMADAPKTSTAKGNADTGSSAS